MTCYDTYVCIWRGPDIGGILPHHMAGRCEEATDFIWTCKKMDPTNPGRYAKQCVLGPKNILVCSDDAVFNPNQYAGNGWSPERGWNRVSHL